MSANSINGFWIFPLRSCVFAWFFFFNKPKIQTQVPRDQRPFVPQGDGIRKLDNQIT